MIVILSLADLDGQEVEFGFKLEVIYEGDSIRMFTQSLGHDGVEDRLLKRLTLTSEKRTHYAICRQNQRSYP